MKISFAKLLTVVTLMALLVINNGCMTYSTVQTARGEPPNFLPGWRMEAHSPKPAYYALVPLTVPLDIVTSPVQLIIFVVLQ